MVPSLVLAEVDYWCHERLTSEAWLAFLDDVLAGAYRYEPLEEGAVATLDHRHFSVVRPRHTQTLTLLPVG